MDKLCVQYPRLKYQFHLGCWLWAYPSIAKKSDTRVAMFRSSLFVRPFGLALLTPLIHPSSPLLHSASPKK